MKRKTDFICDSSLTNEAVRCLCDEEEERFQEHLRKMNSLTAADVMRILDEEVQQAALHLREMRAVDMQAKLKKELDDLRLRLMGG